jgi:hypothetical protein
MGMSGYDVIIEIHRSVIERLVLSPAVDIINIINDLEFDEPIIPFDLRKELSINVVGFEARAILHTIVEEIKVDFQANDVIKCSLTFDKGSLEVTDSLGVTNVFVVSEAGATISITIPLRTDTPKASRNYQVGIYFDLPQSNLNFSFDSQTKSKITNALNQIPPQIPFNITTDEIEQKIENAFKSVFPDE